MWRRLPALLLVLVLSVGTLACAGPRSLSKDEVDARAREYYQRGLEHLARNEPRPALESFQMARAYDTTGRIPELPAFIERTELQLKSGAVAAAPPGPALRGVSATPTPRAEEPFQTFRSRLYPYSVDVPESWSVRGGGTRVGNIQADLLQAPRPRSGSAPSVTVVAHRLPPDVDARAYLEANLKLLRAQGGTPQVVGERLVDAMSGWLVRTPVNNEQGSLMSTIAFFGRDGVGWAVTFSASKEESDRLQPLFHRILDAFRVGNLVTT